MRSWRPKPRRRPDEQCSYTDVTHVALTPGTRLGLYEITAQIGEGDPVLRSPESSASYGGFSVARRNSTVFVSNFGDYRRTIAPGTK